MRRDSKGWHVSLAVLIPSSRPRNSNRVVGVDVGITTFAVLSDGGEISSFRAARRAAQKLRFFDRAVSRKLRGSKGRARALLARRRFHAAVARQRANHLHQASSRLVRDYDV